MTWMGVIAIILGVLAMLAPGIAGVSVAVLVGIFALIGGLIRMILVTFPASFAATVVDGMR